MNNEEKAKGMNMKYTQLSLINFENIEFNHMSILFFNFQCKESSEKIVKIYN